MTKPLALRDIAALYKSKLASSALSLKDGTLLHLETLTGPELAGRGYKPFAGIVIPYFDERGKPLPFERVRYLEDTRTGFDKITKTKERRYDQLKATGIEVYLPPLLTTSWDIILADIESSVVITEGEFKAACACKFGVPTIGLGGVWNFLDAEDKTKLIARLEAAQWKDREVLIVYDSDAASNPDVVKAQNRLAKLLLVRGARVFLIALPNVYPAPKKTGLDDFILERGIEDFKELLNETREPFAASEAFHALNEEVVVVREEKTIVELSTLLRMSLTDFTKLVYAPRKYMAMNKDGELIPKPLAPAWLEWPSRYELRRTTYIPAAPREVDGQLNVWNGWGCLPAPGDVAPYLKLLDYLFSRDSTGRIWFEQWLAFPLQHPGRKIHSAVLFWGPQGVGKTFAADCVAKIYGDNAVTIKNKHFSSNHNTWAERRQFVIGNEILNSNERREGCDMLKEIITQEKVLVNPKFVNEYSIPDCINYFLSSNHSNALIIEPGDRHFFINAVPKHPLPFEFYVSLRAWKDSEAGPPALFDYLLSVDLTGFDPDEPPPLTGAKIEMMTHGASLIDDWALRAVREPEAIIMLGKTPLPYALFSIDELFSVFSEQALSGNAGRYTPNLLAKALRQAGGTPAYNNMGVRTQGGQKRLWIMRDVERLSALSGPELGAAYDNERKAKGRAPAPTEKKRKF